MPQCSKKTLRDAGFLPAARLTWAGKRKPSFAFELGDAGALRSTIYVYVEVRPGRRRVLYVGETGRMLRRRLGEYRRWLNGSVESAVRRRWLACLSQCAPAIEVWAKPSVSLTMSLRVAEEYRWRERLKPVLNPTYLTG